MKKPFELFLLMFSVLCSSCNGPYSYKREGLIVESTRFYSTFTANFYKKAIDENDKQKGHYPKYYYSRDEESLSLNLTQYKVNERKEGDKSYFSDWLAKDNCFSLSISISFLDIIYEMASFSVSPLDKRRDEYVDLEVGVTLNKPIVINYPSSATTYQIEINQISFVVDTDKEEALNKELTIYADIKQETPLEEGDVCQIRFVSKNYFAI